MEAATVQSKSAEQAEWAPVAADFAADGLLEDDPEELFVEHEVTGRYLSPFVTEV
jgi:hypothetical protein